MQTITRKGTFDSGHRVMNERMKCFNLHGHTYLYELTFKFNSMQSIGYAIDFKEIKRVACQWIDDMLDHGMLLNPKDEAVIKLTKKLDNKYWLMSLNGAGNYCNPTAENIAKEIFMAVNILMKPYAKQGLAIHKVKLYETPNCYTVCKWESISDKESENFHNAQGFSIMLYSKDKGVVEYDDRKAN